MFARLQGHDRMLTMPVTGRGDDNDVHRFVSQELFVSCVTLRHVELLRHLLRQGSVLVTNGDDAAAFERLKGLEMRFTLAQT